MDDVRGIKVRAPELEPSELHEALERMRQACAAWDVLLWGVIAGMDHP